MCVCVCVPIASLNSRACFHILWPISIEPFNKSIGKSGIKTWCTQVSILKLLLKWKCHQQWQSGAFFFTSFFSFQFFWSNTINQQIKMPLSWNYTKWHDSILLIGVILTHHSSWSICLAKTSLFRLDTTKGRGLLRVWIFNWSPLCFPLNENEIIFTLQLNSEFSTYPILISAKRFSEAQSFHPHRYKQTHAHII